MSWPVSGRENSGSTTVTGETEDGKFCSPPSGGLVALCLLLLLVTAGFLVSGPGEAILGVAEATNMRLQALLARIVGLVLAFPSHLAAVPLGAGWLILLLRIVFSLLLLPLPLPVWLRNGLYCLHHGGWINLGGDRRPVKDAKIQVREDSSIIIPGSLPGKGAVVGVTGVSGRQLKKMEQMLEPAKKLLI